MYITYCQTKSKSEHIVLEYIDTYFEVCGCYVWPLNQDLFNMFYGSSRNWSSVWGSACKSRTCSSSLFKGSWSTSSCWRSDCKERVGGARATAAALKFICNWKTLHRCYWKLDFKPWFALFNSGFPQILQKGWTGVCGFRGKTTRLRLNL